MFAKFAAFFKNFFGNITADPVSSAKGVVQLAMAGATCYGMATGTVPVSIGAPVAAGFTASGVHALGTNSATGAESATAAKIEQLVNQVASLAPPAVTIADHYNAIKSQAGQAQAILAAASEAASALAVLSPAVSAPAPAPAPAPEPAAAVPTPEPAAPAAAPTPTRDQVDAALATLAAANVVPPVAPGQGA